MDRLCQDAIVRFFCLWRVGEHHPSRSGLCLQVSWLRPPKGPTITSESRLCASALCSVWQETNFDLWEEVNGKHHFNIIITIRALYDAHKFATRLGDTELAEKYKETAEEIEKTALEQFWDKEHNYLKATVDFKNDGGKIRWLDSGARLSFIKLYNPK